MNKFLTLCVGVTCISLNLMSCQNDLVDPVAFENAEKTQDVLTTKSLSTDTVYQDEKFIYAGRTYEYTVTSVNDSIVQISDPEIETLLTQLHSNPNLVTYVHRKGTTEYFDNRESLMNQLPGIIERETMLIQEEQALLEDGIEPYYTGHPWTTTYPPQVKDDNQIANLWLFDDEDYDDTYERFDLKSGESKVEISNLKDYGLNDKVTSLVAYVFGRTVLFEVYEDSNFKDNSFSFTVYPGAATVIAGDIYIKPGPPTNQFGHFAIADLKDCTVMNQSGLINDSWNDRISSVRLTAL